MPILQHTFRRVARVATIAALLLAPARSLGAQGPTLASAQTALSRCSYETCALRLDRSFTGRRVSVGLEGVSSAMGPLGGGLIDAVQPVPAALAEAHAGRRNALKATIATVVASVAAVYAVQGASGDPLLWNDAQVFGGLAVSLAAAGTTLVQMTYAERHFSRAVWLYNREIPR
jgi:hypothetical protein